MPAAQIRVRESFEVLIQNPESLLKALSPWLVTCRWAGLGSINVERIEVLDWMRLASAKHSAIFATLVKIVPKEGVTSEAKIFYVPLHLKREPCESGWIPVRCADGILQVREAEYSKEYNNFLLHGVAESRVIDSHRGTLTFKSLERVPRKLKAENVTILGKGDTTNIVVKVKTGRTQALVLKTYKNVTEINPEPEMLAVLTEAGFSNSPKMVGEMTYTDHRKHFVLTILQKFVESTGDGSQPFAESLRHELQGNCTQRNMLPDPFRLARRVGEIIAAMHHTLGHSQAEGFGASRITKRDIEKFKSRAETLLEVFLEEVSNSEAKLGAFVSELVAMVALRKKKILNDLASMDRMLSMMKIRTHQDLHLAQLVTIHNGETDFLIIDFEGDPQRTGESRREKESPLRDVGTMTRSFSYLRYGVLKEMLEEAGHVDSLRTVASYDLSHQLNLTQVSRTPLFDNWIAISREWEAKVRKAMIEGYLAEVERLGDKFLLERGNVEFKVINSIVRLWEIEKALLEARYELRHRPQNLTIPLSGLLTLCP